MDLVGKLCEGNFKERSEQALGIKDLLHEFGAGKCLLPVFFSDIAQKILDAPIRSDDIWLISFPRTGSTWCQEMIWLIGNNLDYDGNKNTLQQIRAPLIEGSALLYQYTDQFKHLFTNSVDFINSLPSPRYIKSHLHMDLLPMGLNKVKPKIICTMRNPKDVCVSFYYYLSTFHNLNTTFEEYAELFLNGALPFGSIWDHYLPFWAKHDEPNFLILKYEDMTKDPRKTIRKIADFMEKHITEKDVIEMCDFLSIENMRENKSCNVKYFIENKTGEQDYYKKTGTHFFRKGIVGDYKNCMSENLVKRFDEWIEENTKGTGLSFEN